MADQNLRGFLGSKYKSYSHGSSCQESESSYVVPTMLVHEKMDLGEYVLIAKLPTTFLFMRN